MLPVHISAFAPSSQRRLVSMVWIDPARPEGLSVASQASLLYLQGNMFSYKVLPYPFHRPPLIVICCYRCPTCCHYIVIDYHPCRSCCHYIVVDHHSCRSCCHCIVIDHHPCWSCCHYIVVDHHLCRSCCHYIVIDYHPRRSCCHDIVVNHHLCSTCRRLTVMCLIRLKEGISLFILNFLSV